MRVLVCGGRNFTDRELLFETLAELHTATPITALIHGDAKGADRLAGEWGESACVPVVAFPADWKQYRNAAGPIRNKQMLTEGKADLVVAFPGGTGTANMIAQAMATGVTVRRVEPTAAP